MVTSRRRVRCLGARVCGVAMLCVAGLCVAGLCVAGCSGSDLPSGSGGARAGTLTIAIGAPSVGFGATWIALDRGLFKKNGVNVRVVTYNGVQVLPSLLTSGRADLVMNTYSGFFSLMNGGQPAQVVFNLQDYNWRYGTVIAKKEIKSIADLKKLGSGCKLATSAPGTGTYGWMLSFQKAYGLKCHYVDTPTLSAETAAVAGGSADAAVTLLPTAQSAVSAGIANTIFDPSKINESEGRRVVAGAYPAVGVLGLKPNLRKKKAAVTAFVHALVQADAIVSNSTPTQLARMTIHSAPNAWGSQKPAAVAAGWSILPITASGQKPGYVSPDAWKQTVQSQVDWGLTSVDPGSSALAYKNAVDMGYYNAAG